MNVEMGRVYKGRIERRKNIRNREVADDDWEMEYIIIIHVNHRWQFKFGSDQVDWDK